MRNFLLIVLLILVGCGRSDFSPSAERTVEIGFLLRKQFTDDLNEKRHYRHIHLLLADGTIIGFNTSAYQNSFMQNILFTSRGEVQATEELKIVRPHYVNATIAQNCVYKNQAGQKMVTDWVKFKITPTQANALKIEWEKLANNPPTFRLSGKNCATRAHECLVNAGIFPRGGIAGIDRPENMLKTLKKYYPDYTMETGYFGLNENNQPYLIPLK